MDDRGAVTSSQPRSMESIRRLKDHSATRDITDARTRPNKIMMYALAIASTFVLDGCGIARRQEMEAKRAALKQQSDTALQDCNTQFPWREGGHGRCQSSMCQQCLADFETDHALPRSVGRLYDKPYGRC